MQILRSCSSFGYKCTSIMQDEGSMMFSRKALVVRRRTLRESIVGPSDLTYILMKSKISPLDSSMKCEMEML